MNGKRSGDWLIRTFVFLAVSGIICILSFSTVKKDDETSTERRIVKTSETWTQNEVSRPVKSDPVTSNSESATANSAESVTSNLESVTANSESARQVKQDEYDVYDYSAYEDFYDDHEEDFDGEDDAESYYDDAWGDDAWGDDGL